MRWCSEEGSVESGGKRGVRRGSEEEGGRREDELEMRRKRRENKVKLGGR